MYWLTITLPLFLCDQAWSIVICVSAAGLVPPTLAFAIRHRKPDFWHLDSPYECLTEFLQWALIVVGAIALILLISDHCPFPRRLFRDGYPTFRGASELWSGAASLVSVLLVLPFIYVSISPCVSCFERIMCLAPVAALVLWSLTSNWLLNDSEAGEVGGLICFFVSWFTFGFFGSVVFQIGWLYLALSILIVSPVLVQSTFGDGLLLFPLAIHACRTLFLPWPGTSCFLVATGIALIHLIYWSCDRRWKSDNHTFWIAVLFWLLFVTWAIQLACVMGNLSGAT